MMRIALFFVAVALAIAQPKLPPAANVKIDFETHIQPILAQKCHSCHGQAAQQAGLRLDRRQAAMRGGDYGPVILPGNSAESKLIKRVVSGDGGLQMPPTEPLSAEEIGLLRAWIDQGADFRISVQEEAPARPVDPKVAAFIAAVRAADMKEVEKQIASNPDLVNGKDREGSTPLHHAAGFSTPAVMKLLLDKGANPNAANRRKSTPLFWAIRDMTKFRMLLEAGADVNAKLIENRTLVHQAASIGNGISLLKLLLEKGAKSDVKTIVGVTPLMLAAGRANVEAMQLLIAAGANVNSTTAAGATPLMAAAQTGKPAAVRLLLDKGAAVNAATKRNHTALADAATSGNEETIKMLLESGAKVDVPDDRGYTALVYAAGSDAMPANVVKMLLAHGADPSMKGDGETAAMLAAKRGDTEVARLLGVSAQQRTRPAATVVPATGVRERSIADAVKPAFELLEKQSHNFIRIGGCNSCHAQDLPSAAAAVARKRGLPAPQAIPQLPQHMENNNSVRLMDLNAIGVTSIAWELFDLGMNDMPADAFTDAAVHFIKAMQTPAGNWYTGEGRRPPMSAGAYQAAALAIYSIKHYGPPSEKLDNEKAIARAAAWLETAKPTTNQDRAFHLLGLAWANARPAVIRAAAATLAATQRPDGGWAQLPAMATDAYATGEALYALASAGKMPTTDPTYKRGVKYLLQTQAADGSWHVKSRSIWLQPYFESGFPYAHDQWISAAGTAWATMALSLTVEPQRITQNVTAK